MRIYRTSFWPEQSAYVRASTIQGLPEFDGGCIDARFKMPFLNMYEGTRNDFFDFWPGAPIINKRAYETLKERLRGQVQFFPVSIGLDGELHWLFNCTNVIDCLDTERSAIKYRESDGKFSRVIEFAFLPSKIGSSLIFKIPQTARTELYCTSEFKMLCKASGLKGIVPFPIGENHPL